MRISIRPDVPVQWCTGSSKEKGGSGAHDHSRHKIATHSIFPRHKITPKIQKLYLSMFYPSPSTKHAIRHIFEPIYSNPHKLHQDEFHTTKVDYSRDQGSLQMYKKFPMLSKFPTVIRDLFFCSRYVTDDSRTLPQWGVDRMSTGCRLGVDWVSTRILGVD